MDIRVIILIVGLVGFVGTLCILKIDRPEKETPQETTSHSPHIFEIENMTPTTTTWNIKRYSEDRNKKLEKQKPVE